VKNRVEKQVSAGKANRFMELEGLRGIAALMVFAYHALIIFYPLMFYGSAPLQHFKFEDNIHGTPLAAFFSGTFAVAIFFVLSGFVLSIGFFTAKDAKVIKKLATKRYLRLMLPALASVMIALVLISLSLSSNPQAQQISQSPALPVVWSTHPGFLEALYEGTIGVFFQSPVHNYNSVLWTMKFEFIGSFIVFGFALLFGQSKRRWLMYVALAIGLHNSWYLGFVLGMAIADAYVNRNHWLERVRSIAPYALLPIGVVLGAYPIVAKGTAYGMIALPWLTHYYNQAFYTTIGAFCLVLAVLTFQPLKRIMGSKVLSRLGSYTYSFYLVHQPLLYTVGTALFMVFIGHMGYNRSVAFSLLLTIPVVAASTYLFHRYIETPSVKLANGFERSFSGEQEWNRKEVLQKIHAVRRRLKRLYRRKLQRPAEVDMEME
jgi:peptidoglycan/LPS O-acetylase OafA/YrhL